MTVESDKRISKVLVIADASSQAWLLISDALRKPGKDHLQSVRVIFISFLSETLKMSLNPKVLNLLLKEERETLEKAKKYFDQINKPYDLKVIIAPPWKTVLDEIGDGNHNLLILQGKFFDLWGEYTTRGCAYREMMESQKYSVLAIGWPADASFRSAPLNIDLIKTMEVSWKALHFNWISKPDLEGLLTPDFFKILVEERIPPRSFPEELWQAVLKGLPPLHRVGQESSRP
jgi:hypothetical protein